MAVTRLERKGRKNKTVAKARVSAMKRLTKKPVIKNVDIEALKSEFGKSAKKAEPKSEVKEAPVVEAEVTAEAPKAEKAEKKAPAKKKAAPKKKED